MDYRETEVYKYILSLEQYAFGDLLLFHKLSSEAENKELEIREEKNNDPITTKYPFGFEFAFGEPNFCRATIPFALMIFSCIDILGYLIKGKKHTETKENIKAFYNYILSRPSDDELDCLVNIFRHGLAHNYFPKLGQAISYHSKNPNTLFFKDAGTVCLNVNVLERHFEEGFQGIKQDSTLYGQMNENFSLLIKHYQEKEKCNLLGIDYA